ncbi:hypothetical protein NIES4101_53210 [Calothrix sp. NIES-4101]|nr:hypothetical protein NIES4101_53210 [Calothrix sp. NIES-4101]
MPMPFLSGRIPQRLFDAVEARAQTDGKTRTQIMVEAISAYLNIPYIPEPQKPTIEELAQRLAELEKTVQEMKAEKKSPPPLKDFFADSYDRHYGNKK